MLSSVIFSIVVVIGVTIGVSGTLPAKNTIKDDVLTTRYMLGTSKKLDISGVKFEPVPEDAKDNLIRTNGTSLGRKHNGHFKNIRTGRRFVFRITGNGERMFFVKDGVNYVVDLER